MIEDERDGFSDNLSIEKLSASDGHESVKR